MRNKNKTVMDYKATSKWILLILFGAVEFGKSQVFDAQFAIEDKWNDGFTGKITFLADRPFKYGWVLYITFDIPINNFEVYEAEIIGEHPDKKIFIVQYASHNKVLHIDSTGKRNLFCKGFNDQEPTAVVLFIALLNEFESVDQALKRGLAYEIDSKTSKASTTTTTTTTVSTTTVSTSLGAWWELTTRSTTTPTNNGPVTKTTTTTEAPNLASFNLKYNLREVISKSLLFFEAQRSGLLPESNRIPWRDHSALRDGSDNKVDLSGGYYVDSGYIKYGFPMAFSMTLLAWGVDEFRTAYLAAHQLPGVLNALKWGTDYFIKCHSGPYQFYGQVSNTDIDFSFWGRPEDYPGTRPSYKLTKKQAGSDLLAETAAAMAATAIVFNQTNATYSSVLLEHAIQLYKFADRYRDEYHNSIPDAKVAFKSWNGYWDELAWGAIWLYKATKDEKYIAIARSRLENNEDTSKVTTFSWDDKRAGAHLLLYQITKEDEFLNKIHEFCDHILPGGGADYTPRGLLYLNEWGPIKHAANAAIICLIAANEGMRPGLYSGVANRQLAYILGDGGQSYMVGFGENFPDRPYHRASSCPDLPAPCSWDEQASNNPNPQQLTGAVVGGPDKWDNFKNDRKDFKTNAVALDFNAGVQTLAAGILNQQVTGQTFSEPNPEELNAAVSETFSISHDYAEVLRKSILFYEAQRSGKLPKDNRIPWRRDSFLNDRGDNGEDLSGGYFDAGDYVKFNFPMAYSTTALAWGLLAYEESYKVSGELQNAREMIKWATDYFIKCHVSKYEYYGQVGSGVIDHTHWNTPEGMEKVARPAFKVTSRNPGTEVVAETAAAMAAASMVFREVDPDYSGILIGHAKDLFEFADKFREQYHRSITDAGRFYRSFSGFEDELVWAATWLYIATTDDKYLNIAQAYHSKFKLSERHPESFMWDDKTAGVNLLLAQITRKQPYMRNLQSFCDRFQPGGQQKYTPRGLVYINQWGPLRHVSGVCFICLGAANLGIRPEKYRAFARRQIHYILGDSGLGSYLIGYGPNPPTRPHHRSSSCPDPPATCGFQYFWTQNRNPHILYGAVIGGPNENDQFHDKRDDPKTNEVALDYNACFQSAIAGLKYLELHPPITTTTQSTIAATQEGTTDYDVENEVTTASLDGIDFNIYEFENENLDEENATSISQTANTSFVDQSNNTTESSPVFNTTYVEVTTLFNDIISNITDVTLPNTTIDVTTSSTPESTTFMSQTNVPIELLDSNQTTSIMEINKNNNSLVTTMLMNTTTTVRVIELTKSTTTLATQKAINKLGDQCEEIAVLRLFTACSIERDLFPRHRASQSFTCRFNAFTECVEHNGALCQNLWDPFPYWNDEASDLIYYSDDDRKCSERHVLSRKKCLVRGLMVTFDECYKTSQIVLQPSNSTTAPTCRWALYKKCVDDFLSHCTNTWGVWELWNSKPNSDELYFTEQQKICPGSGANSLAKHFSLTLFLMTSLCANLLQYG